MKDKLRLFTMAASLSFVVWSFTAWAGHDTRITVIESNFNHVQAQRAEYMETVKRIEKSISALAVKK